MNVGIIGSGLMGKRRARALQKFPDMKLMAVSDSDTGKAKALADEMACEFFSDWQQITDSDDIDIIIICTPPVSHHEISLRAFRSGKHVLCEKPLALTCDEAREMVEVARENGVILKCGFNHRHHPAIARAKTLVDEGAIGELMYIRSCYGIGGNTGYEKDWRMDPGISGGGQLMDQGMHLIDLIRWFLGDIHENKGSVQTGFWDIAVEDNAFAILSNKRGQIALMHASWTQWKNRFSFEISGKDGYVNIEGLGGSYGTEKLIVGMRKPGEPFSEEITEFRGEDQSWYEEWKEFVRSIETGSEPVGSGYDGLQGMMVAHSIYNSAGQIQLIK